MIESFKIKISHEYIQKRVISILGVPEQLLSEEVVSSPIFIKQTENYINKAIKNYLDLIELCVGMDARLPKQMENLSTKTVLNSINWDEKALELLAKAEEALDDFLEEFEDENGYNTFAELSDEMEYPETNI